MGNDEVDGHLWQPRAEEQVMLRKPSKDRLYICMLPVPCCAVPSAAAFPKPRCQLRLHRLAGVKGGQDV
jgi:hypothetical protein